MNMTKKKKLSEVLALVEDDQKLFLVGCDGCPVGTGSGGVEHVAQLGRYLTKKGKKITGKCTIDFLCNKALVGVKLGRYKKQLKGCDAIVVSSCGVGVQAVAAMVDIRAVPAQDTISLGGAQGIWPGDERCGTCGDCMLGVTGGICPIVTCSKSLVNGACGGTDDGMCEISPDKPCGWLLIYERLKSLGRLDDLKKMNPPRDHSKREVSKTMRASTRWALEWSEKQGAP